MPDVVAESALVFVVCRCASDGKGYLLERGLDETDWRWPYPEVPEPTHAEGCPGA